MLRPNFAVLLLLAAAFALAPLPASASGAPGKFDYYALVLSWQPTYCQREGDSRHDGQCSPGHESGFVLHGLWPQYENGWPSDCHLPRRPWVSQSVIEQMRPVMPSKALVIHEYRTHGTCSGLDPETYFRTARALYAEVTIPPALVGLQSSELTSPLALEQQFLAANAWLKPNMIAVSCRGRNLLDVRLCFGKDLEPRACGGNENQSHLCADPAIGVPAPR
jgi:ribonuclease T2